MRIVVAQNSSEVHVNLLTPELRQITADAVAAGEAQVIHHDAVSIDTSEEAIQRAVAEVGLTPS